MTRPFLRLLAITVLALAVGFVAGLRAATTFGDHYRWMAPSAPATLAYEPKGGDARDVRTLHSQWTLHPIRRDTRPSLTIEAGWAGQSSSGASTPVAAPAPETLRDGTAARASSVQAGEPIVGIASHYGAGYGSNWLALPEGSGIRVRVCAAACIVRVSNDAGPDLAMQRAGRVVDLSFRDFETVCGCPASRGLARVTVEYLP